MTRRFPHRKPWRLALALPVALLAGCAAIGTPPPADLAWHDSRQMVLVITPDWDATRATLRGFERTPDGAWRAVGAAAPVELGRNGSAWGLGLNVTPTDGGPVKREGDGRNPAGVFAIGMAFGYAPHAATALRYEQMAPSSWCVDVSGSPYYNRIVDADVVGKAAVAGASERMRLDLVDPGDARYRLGFVIEHNTQQQALGGSCIFAHLWKTPTTTTAGCTAMAAPVMERLLGWLDQARQPVFVLLPEAEYRRLRDAWRLPRVTPSR